MSRQRIQSSEGLASTKLLASPMSFFKQKILCILISRANRATEAVSALEDLHALRRKRGSSSASSHSLFLEEILVHGGATGDASSSSGASAEDASKSGVKVVGGGGGGGDTRGAEDRVKSLKVCYDTCYYPM